MNRKLLNDFSLSAGLGAAIWALAPLFVNEVEPWDAPGYYVVAILATGVAIGALRTVRWWLLWTGLAVGQLMYLLAFLPIGPLLPLGVLFLAAYSLLGLATANLLKFVRRALRR